MKKLEQQSNQRWMVALAVSANGVAKAAPIEGELGSNAAALLVLLGLGALFMGLRNLRELRHKRLAPDRQFPQREDEGNLDRR